MFNPLTGQVVETGKVVKVSSLILGGAVLTFTNALKAVSGTIYNTTEAVEIEMNKKTRKRRLK